MYYDVGNIIVTINCHSKSPYGKAFQSICWGGEEYPHLHICLVHFQIVLDFIVSENKGQFSRVDKRMTSLLLYDYSVFSPKSGVANVTKLISDNKDT